MFYVAPVQQTSTANLLSIFQRMEIQQRVLNDNQANGTGENTFNCDEFATECTHE